MTWFQGAALAASTAASLFGASKSRKAEAKANERAQAELNAAKGRGIEAIRSGTDEAMGYIAPTVAESEGGGGYLRSVMGQNPNQLFPWQKTALDDTIRNANATLAASGLRGAGRAGVATVNEATRRATEGFQRTNQGRSDSAASSLFAANQAGRNNLSRLASGEGTQIANTELGVGSQNAGLETATGQANAGAINTATNAINRGLGGAAAMADDPSVVSSLRGIFASDTKEQQLRDQYGSGVSDFGNR